MTRQHAHRPQKPYPRVTWRTIAHDVFVAVLVLVVFIAWTAVAVGVEA